MEQVRFILALLLISLLLHTSISYASTRAHTLSFTAGGGYDYFSSKRHLKNTGFPFLALGYQFTDQLGIETAFGVFTTDSKRPEEDDSTVHGGFFLVDGMYHFKNYSLIEPFLLAGIGITNFNPSGTDAHNVGNVNLGGGIQLFFDPSVALRLEARDLITTAGGKHDLLLMAGVNFLLDLC